MDYFEILEGIKKVVKTDKGAFELRVVTAK